MNRSQLWQIQPSRGKQPTDRMRALLKYSVFIEIVDSWNRSTCRIRPFIFGCQMSKLSEEMCLTGRSNRCKRVTYIL